MPRWEDGPRYESRATGPGSGAAGRDFHQQNSEQNFHYHGESPRDISITYDSIKKMFSDNFILEQQRDSLWRERARYEAEAEHSENALAAGQSYIGQLRHHIQELENQPTVGLDQHIKRLGVALLCGALVGVFIMIFSGHNHTKTVAKRLPATTRTVVRTSTVPASPSVSASATTLTTTAMPCVSGTVVDRLAYVPSTVNNSDIVAEARLHELVSRFKSYHVQAPALGITPLDSGCQPVVADISKSGFILWAGPFSTSADASDFCSRAGFRTDVHWDCFPRRVP